MGMRLCFRFWEAGIDVLSCRAVLAKQYIITQKCKAHIPTLIKNGCPIFHSDSRLFFVSNPDSTEPNIVMRTFDYFAALRYFRFT